MRQLTRGLYPLQRIYAMARITYHLPPNLKHFDPYTTAMWPAAHHEGPLRERGPSGWRAARAVAPTTKGGRHESGAKVRTAIARPSSVQAARRTLPTPTDYMVEMGLQSEALRLEWGASSLGMGNLELVTIKKREVVQGLVFQRSYLAGKKWWPLTMPRH